MNQKTTSLFILLTLLLLGCTPHDYNIKPIDGMVYIPGGIYQRGANTSDQHPREDEKPAHTVQLDGFYMDITEVTNAAFAQFVEETNYITVAERNLDWDEMKKQLPEDTPRPHDSIFVPGSLSFQCKHHSIKNLNDVGQWWTWKTGANWRNPQGKGSNILGKDDEPVVHIAYEDALAYCTWIGHRLPTEAEWEFAARGGLKDQIFPWGNEEEALTQNANTWQGEFPNSNTKLDGYERSAPVKSYPPNGYGLYDMAGNVWEWTQDWYDPSHYKTLSNSATNTNPLGPHKPNNLKIKEKTIRGGSFLCHVSYCSSYRVSARMAASVDTGLEHLGFRTVLSPTNKY